MSLDPMLVCDSRQSNQYIVQCMYVDTAIGLLICSKSPVARIIFAFINDSRCIFGEMEFFLY